MAEFESSKADSRIPLRLVWATDVHLNFLSDAQAHAFCHRLRALAPDKIVLSGDIAESHSLEYWLRFVVEATRRPLYFVLGNHDFYDGSIAHIKALARSLGELEPNITWLSGCAPIALSPNVAVLGQDGWGDGRFGRPTTSRVMLNDWRAIEELAMLPAPQRLAALRTLGEKEAAALAPRLEAALCKYQSVLIVTHVPPFREACWHEGKISDDDWLPWFTCAAIGEVLLLAADRHPHRRITVLCGHTHGAGRAELRPNLVVHTGPATYGSPEIAGTLLITRDFIEVESNRIEG